MSAGEVGLWSAAFALTFGGALRLAMLTILPGLAIAMDVLFGRRA